MGYTWIGSGMTKTHALVYYATVVIINYNSKKIYGLVPYSTRSEKDFFLKSSQKQKQKQKQI